MKKHSMIFMAMLLGMMLMSVQIYAKEFKGVITYKITYTGGELNEQMKSFLPKLMTTSFKGFLTRTDMIMGMGKTMKIKNGEDQSVITLLDIMGQKIAVKAGADEVQADLDNEMKASVEVVSETKEILGYACKKAIVTMTSDEGQEDIIIVYFTDALGNNSNYFDTPEFKDIDGIMLEFEIPTPEFTMHFTASSIEKKNVAKTEFEIPEDFEVKTKEEVEAMFGGM